MCYLVPISWTEFYDDFMRAAIATPNYGLAAMWACGRSFFPVSSFRLNDSPGQPDVARKAWRWVNTSQGLKRMGDATTLSVRDPQPEQKIAQSTGNHRDPSSDYTSRAAHRTRRRWQAAAQPQLDCLARHFRNSRNIRYYVPFQQPNPGHLPRRFLTITGTSFPDTGALMANNYYLSDSNRHPGSGA
jgi:hypothetical protein